jgi:acyl carrier protein
MLEELKAIICNYIPVEESQITESATLRGDLAMSSLDLIDLAVEVEEKYGIELPNEDLAGITTVNDLIKYISLKK